MVSLQSRDYHVRGIGRMRNIRSRWTCRQWQAHMEGIPCMRPTPSYRKAYRAAWIKRRRWNWAVDKLAC